MRTLEYVCGSPLFTNDFRGKTWMKYKKNSNIFMTGLVTKHIIRISEVYIVWSKLVHRIPYSGNVIYQIKKKYLRSFTELFNLS